MFKKSSIIILLFFCSNYTNSQTIQELLNYSIDKPNGTARFESMGGAFGALGGDLSAININPASSSVFNDNEYGFTLGTQKKSNNSIFFGNPTATNNSRFSFNHGGGVWLLKNYGEGNIKKVSFAINAQTNNSYEDFIEIRGKNPINSIDKFFLNNSIGFNADDLSVGNNETVSGVYKFLGQNYGYSSQQAFLAYQAYLLNFDTNSNAFVSQAKYDNGVDQRHIFESKGVNTKYNLNISMQFKEDYYFGLNINTHEIRSESYIIHKENNFSIDSPINEITFENSIVTGGEGFSFQLGGIAKFNKFRLGITYDSPTWYSLWDETFQSLETKSTDSNGLNYIDKIDPRILNSYPRYTIKTPSKLTTSAAIIFGKIGLISLDLISVDYSNIKLKPHRDFSIKNSKISNELSNTLNIRFGGELRLNQLSLRTGYSEMKDPYKRNNMYNTNKSMSLGLGYDFGETLINISYLKLENNKTHQLFDSGLTDLSLIKSNNYFTNLSIIFKF